MFFILCCQIADVARFEVEPSRPAETENEQDGGQRRRRRRAAYVCSDPVQRLRDQRLQYDDENAIRTVDEQVRTLCVRSQDL